MLLHCVHANTTSDATDIVIRSPRHWCVPAVVILWQPQRILSLPQEFQVSADCWTSVQWLSFLCKAVQRLSQNMTPPVFLWGKDKYGTTTSWRKVRTSFTFFQNLSTKEEVQEQFYSGLGKCVTTPYGKQPCSEVNKLHYGIADRVPAWWHKIL